MKLRIQLDGYQGPLDLLLYLIRKEEMEVAELQVSEVTQQFLEAVAVLEKIDLDEIADYLELAAQLIELKSRVVLPRHEEIEQEIEDPHENLVQRLLEYKQFRDAAALLEERDTQQRLRFGRQARDLSQQKLDPSDQPLETVELWDLVSAFARVMRDNLAAPEDTSIPYDETPVQVYMSRIYRRVAAEEQVRFTTLFEGPVAKSTLVATFLAVLELVRHRHTLADQSNAYGDIVLSVGQEPYVDLREEAAETDLAKD